MLAPNKQLLLSKAQRTVVFTSEEAKSIYDLMNSCEPEAITRALEEITQHLLNNLPGIRKDIGDYYFVLRQLRNFYSCVAERLKPVHDAYSDLLAEMNTD